MLYEVITDKDLAIEAYALAPARFRKPFDETIAQADAVVAHAIATVGAALDAGETERAAFAAEQASRMLQRLIDVASGIIHGSEKGMSQAEIDIVLGDP